MQNNIRKVANKEVYDSYMGILRISPDANYKDDITSDLQTIGNEIILSDSDGNKLGGSFCFKPRGKVINAYKKDGNYEPTKLIFVEASCGTVKVLNSFNTRNFFILKKPEDTTDKTCKFTILNNDTLVGYPIESPHDNIYFNDNKKLINSNATFTVNGETKKFSEASLNNSRYEFIKEYLKAQPKSWYDNNNLSSHYVVINGKVITYPNNDNDLIPAIYTHDYALGHYEGHNFTVNGNNKWFDDNQGALNATKLSWIDIDKLIWDELSGLINGNSRHWSGRYVDLGLEGNNLFNSNGEERFFGPDVLTSNGTILENSTIYPSSEDKRLHKTAPILGVSVQPRTYYVHCCTFKTSIIPYSASSL